ncbi:MAG: sugar-binding protein, partial [Bacteroidaceae bacterium]|nr:sugar-binding protein [Bacteroidaceae bacterium]
YFCFDVKDSKVKVAPTGSDPWDTDGIEIYLDPKEKASSSIVSGLYKILVNVNNVCASSYSDGSVWKDWTPKITYTVQRPMSQNYTIQVAIPWTEIGGEPTAGEFAAMFKLHNNDGTATIVHENLSGANPDVPQTWMRVKMLSAQGTGIKSVNKQNNPKLLTPENVRKNQPFSISLDNGSLSKSKIYVYEAASGILLASCQNNTTNCMIPALNTKGLIIIVAELPNKCTLKKKILVE